MHTYTTPEYFEKCYVARQAFSKDKAWVYGTLKCSSSVSRKKYYYFSFFTFHDIMTQTTRQTDRHTDRPTDRQTESTYILSWGICFVNQYYCFPLFRHHLIITATILCVFPALTARGTSTAVVSSTDKQNNIKWLHKSHIQHELKLVKHSRWAYSIFL